MHECEECGQMCDCDGDDLAGPQPDDHVCINPECGEDGDLVDDTDFDSSTVGDS